MLLVVCCRSLFVAGCSLFVVWWFRLVCCVRCVVRCVLSVFGCRCSLLLVGVRCCPLSSAGVCGCLALCDAVCGLLLRVVSCRWSLPVAAVLFVVVRGLLLYVVD